MNEIIERLETIAYLIEVVEDLGKRVKRGELKGSVASKYISIILKNNNKIITIDDVFYIIYIYRKNRF